MMLSRSGFCKVTAILVALGAFSLSSCKDPQDANHKKFMEEQARLQDEAKKELKRLQEEAARKLAELKAAVAEGEIAVKEAEAKTKAVLARNAIQQRLIAIAHAYFDAQVKLGRAPKELAELKPHLKREEDLLAPESGKPFGIAWAVDFSPKPGVPKKLVCWAPESDPEGGRWVYTVQAGSLGTYEYLKDSEFQKLLQEIQHVPPNIPVTFAQDKPFEPLPIKELELLKGVWESSIDTKDGTTGTLRATISFKPGKDKEPPFVTIEILHSLNRKGTNFVGGEPGALVMVPVRKDKKPYLHCLREQEYQTLVSFEPLIKETEQSIKELEKMNDNKEAEFLAMMRKDLMVFKDNVAPLLPNGKNTVAYTVEGETWTVESKNMKLPEPLFGGKIDWDSKLVWKKVKVK